MESSDSSLADQVSSKIARRQVAEFARPFYRIKILSRPLIYVAAIVLLRPNHLSRIVAATITKAVLENETRWNGSSAADSSRRI